MKTSIPVLNFVLILFLIGITVSCNKDLPSDHSTDPKIEDTTEKTIEKETEVGEFDVGIEHVDQLCG